MDLNARMKRGICHLPDVFLTKYRTNKDIQPRRRAFTSKSFFLTIIQLVSGTNSEGYLIALMKVFIQEEGRRPPTKSALSQFREKISWTFFRDAFEHLRDSAVEQSEHFFDGMRVVAIDGLQLYLPRSKQLIEEKFSGRATSRYRESWYPRSYATLAYDVLNGIIMELCFHPTLNEIKDAIQLVQTFSSKTLFLYDRLFFNEKLVQQHYDLGSRFIIRARRNAHKRIDRFFANDRIKGGFDYLGHRLHMIKTKHPKTGEVSVFVTNLSQKQITPDLIKRLYRLRWDIENTFRELTSTTKGEQWHSATLNGIRQELYAKLWLINCVKLTMGTAGQKPIPYDRETYRRSNFKLVFTFIRDNLQRLWTQIHYLIAHVKDLVTISEEKRKKCSRSYRRELKTPASPYPRNTTEWAWDKAQSLN